MQLDLKNESNESNIALSFYDYDWEKE